MIIVSQEKTEAINFDNIVRLSVSPNTSGQFLIEVHNFCDDFETVIGIYETEERAKEVLQEIINNYANSQIVKLPNMQYEKSISSKQLAKFMCYEMPEE